MSATLSAQSKAQSLRYFDTSYYLNSNPDILAAVAAGRTTAFDHFVNFGAREGRSPTPLFNSSSYLANNPDIAFAVGAGRIHSAWDHFVNMGIVEGRSNGAFVGVFDSAAYLAANKDVAAAISPSGSGFRSAYEHFLLFGDREGRAAFNKAGDAISTQLVLTADTPSVTEGNAGTKALTFTLTLSSVPTEAITVNYKTLNSGTATANDDYQVVAGTLTFAAGQRTTTLTVNVLGDTAVEQNETVQVQFSGARLKSSVTATGTITNDDTANAPVGAVSDSNAAANSVAENTAAGTVVGITAAATDPQAGDTVSYALTSNPGNLFAIDAATGVVTVAGALDFETAASHSITVRATSSDGTTSNADFAITVTDVAETQTFTLTTGVDNVSGGADNEIVNAVVGGINKTADLEDTIDLSTGTDTANLRMVGNFDAGSTGEFIGVENVNLRVLVAAQSANDVAIVLPDMTALSVQNGILDVTVNGLDYAQTTVTLDGTTGQVNLDGTGATANVVLGANFASDLDVNTATRLNVSISDDTTVDDVANQDLTTLFVSGTGDFTLTTLTEEGLTTINTTGLTGNADLSGVAVDATSGDRSVTLGAGDDRLALVGAINDAANDTTFTGGGGTDTLVIDTNIVDTSGTTGFEVIELANTVTFAADSVSGLETIVVAGNSNTDVGNITNYTSDIELILSDRNVSAAADTLAISVIPDNDSLDAANDEITIGITTTVVSDTELTVDNVGVRDDNNGDTFETLNIIVSGTRGVIISGIDDDAGGAILSTTININSSVDLTVLDMALRPEDVTVNFGSSTGTIVAAIATADLEAGDVVTGGAATDDVLNLNIGAVTVNAEISGFETIAVTASGAGTFSLADVTATTIEINDAGAAFSVTNAVSGQDFVLTDGGNFNVTINAASASSSIDVALTENIVGTTLVTGDNVTRVNITNSDADQTLAEWDLNSAVTTLFVSGNFDVTLANPADLSSVTTLNLSGLEAAFDGSTFILGDGVTVTLSGDADDSSFAIDGANGVVDRFVFGDDIALGVQIDIADFHAGFANGDVLNLSALGVTNIADLTIAYDDGAVAGTNGDETLTITAVDTDVFAGTIVLTGLYNGTSDLASNNFVFV